MDQETALNSILNEPRCQFLTGRAGTGKSYLTKQVLENFDKLGIKYALTASTGIAARNINGQTLHSYLGFGLGRLEEDNGQPEDFNKFVQRCRFSPYFNMEGILHLDALLIDEVSMLSGQFLDDINRLFIRIREIQKPFGGVKVIFIGDFLQLPPVSKAIVPPWAFKSLTWQRSNIKPLYLQKSYRHSDPLWLRILDELRVGTCSTEVYEALMARVIGSPKNFDGTILMTHNNQVDHYNDMKLREIKSPSRTFWADSKGKGSEKILKDMITPERLELKIGAKVLCTVNKPDESIYNGSFATVVSFNGDTITVELEGGNRADLSRHYWKDPKNEECWVRQFPLRLAYAISIHKSQGMTLDKVLINASQAFAPAQFYVAMSRCRTLEGVSLTTFDPSCCFADGEAIAFYKALE
jgi:ATP-dependent exoDNAse (exonuclease V) alpha subunit